MSFMCKGCNRQRAGSPAEGDEFCSECRGTPKACPLRLSGWKSSIVASESFAAFDSCPHCGAIHR
jgi:hypothetical protein